MSCIYIIKNILSNKLYVGKTYCFEKRKNSHLSKLRRGNHFNKHLQHSYNKNGESIFVFEILEECDEAALDEREMYWISFYNSTDDSIGYNLTYGGQGGKPTEQTRERQSNARSKDKKKVYGFTFDGDFLKSWESVKDCARELSVNPCDVRRTINQTQSTCRGMILQNDLNFKKRLSKSERAKLRERNNDGTFKQLSKI